MIDVHEYLDSVRHRLIHEEDLAPAEQELPLSLIDFCAGFLTKTAWGRLWCVALMPWDQDNREELTEALDGLQAHLDGGYVSGPPRQGIAVLVGQGPVPEITHAKLSVWRVDLAAQVVSRGPTAVGAPSLPSLDNFAPVDWDAAPDATLPDESERRGFRPAAGEETPRVRYGPPGGRVLSLGRSDRQWATNLLLATVWGVALLMLLQGGGLGLLAGFPGRTLVKWGSQYAPAILAGQWWRLGTAMFLHGGLLHLAFNSYALYVLGPSLERLYGHGRYLLIYLGAGLVASTTSFLSGTSNAVGASGAIFGLMGAYIYYAWYVPGAARRRLWAGIWPTLLINLLFGLSVPFIDNWAHIGGLVGGLTFSALLGLPGEDVWTVRRLAGVALLSALLLLGVPRLLAVAAAARGFLR